jgi:diguanylate cyclase (GGDEF)-like protein
MPNMSLIDPLTQVYRRDALAESIQDLVSRSSAANTQFSILFIDIDHFKSVNDAFGHLRGDAVLKEIASRMKAALRERDMLFRYSGDEFIVIAAEADLLASSALANRLLIAVADTPMAGVPPINCTLSIGVACFPEDGRDVNALLGCADQRAYAAKRGGRNRMVADTSRQTRPRWQSMRPRMIDRDLVLASLREMIALIVTDAAGSVVINGHAGAGHTRLIEECEIMALQLGLRVLHISGDAEALRHGQTPGAYSALERTYLRRSGDTLRGKAAVDTVDEWFSQPAPGLVLIDNWHATDAETKKLITAHISEARTTQRAIGVVIASATDTPALDANSGRVDNAWDWLNGNSTTAHASVNQVELSALSRQAFVLFVDSIFMTRFDAGFYTWAYDASAGLPGLALRIFHAMDDQGLIRLEQDHVILSPDFRRLDLNAIRIKDVPHNLPLSYLGLIGRETSIATVASLLVENRLVTLLGTGGIGKSALALQVAIDTRYRFKDGAWFVELAQVTDRPMLVFAIAKTLKLSLNASLAPVAALASALAKSQMLLVLDNLEQVTDEAAVLIVKLLAACPQLSILVTSRVRLSIEIATEAIYQVPLLIPLDQTIATTTTTAAATLFIARAKSAQPRFVVTPDKLVAIENICQKLDGLPLAIELAAARLRTLPLAEIVNRLDKRLTLLGRSGRTYQHNLTGSPEEDQVNAVVERGIGHPQHTLRESIQLSIQLLSEAEVSTFAELSVMGGRFDVTSINALIGRSTEDEIAALADASLLNEKLIDDVPTFLMLETLREFGQSLLHDQGRWPYMKVRHLRYVAKVAAIGRSEPVGVALQKWRAQLDRMSGDMREALSWAISSGANQEFQSGLAAYGDSQTWWELGGRWMESLTWWERFLPQIQSCPQSAALASATVHAARANFMLARYDECECLYQNALDIANAVGDMQSAATALTGLGNHANFRGETADARTFYTQALHRYRSLADSEQNSGFTSRVAYCLNTLGLIARQAGQKNEQLDLYREAAQLRELIGDEFGLAQSNMCLGTAYNDIGAPATALPYFTLANSVLRGFAESRFLSMSLSQEIVSHTLLNDPARGLKNVPEIFTLARAAHDRRRCLFTLAVSVAPLRMLGQTSLAVSISSAVYALSQREGITLLTPELAMMQRDRESIRGLLDEPAHRHAIRLGEAWSLDEAMLALLVAIDELNRSTLSII